MAAARTAIGQDPPDLDSAGTALELAQAEFEGLPEAAKKAAAAELEAAKKAVADAKKAVIRKNLAAGFQKFVDTTKERIAAKEDVSETLDKVEERLRDPELKTVLTAEEIAANFAVVAGLRKANGANLLPMLLPRLEEEVEEFAKRYPDWYKRLKDGDNSDRRNVQGTFDQESRRIDGYLRNLPADHPQVAAAAAKYLPLTKQFRAEVARQMSGEVVARMKETWDNSFSAGAAGWEKETAGATLKEVLGGADRLNAPKTAAVVQLADRWLEDWNENEQAKALAEEPAVKAAFNRVKALRKAASDRLARFAEAVVVEAEKAGATDATRNRLASFADDDLRILLAGHPRQAELQARLKTLVETLDKAAVAAEEARKELYRKLAEKAAAEWPGISAKLGGAEGFDPAKAADYKGKTFRLTITNVIGYDFKRDGFDFAARINGVPFAGVYAPEVKETVKDVQKKTRRFIPDEKMIIVAVYEGTRGRLLEFHDRTTDLGGGNKVKSRIEIPVEVPVIRIIGLYSGPVAVGVGAGSSSKGVEVETPAVAAAPAATGAGPTGGTPAASSGGATTASGGAALASDGAAPAGAEPSQGRRRRWPRFRSPGRPPRPWRPRGGC